MLPATGASIDMNSRSSDAFFPAFDLEIHCSVDVRNGEGRCAP